MKTLIQIGLCTLVVGIVMIYSLLTEPEKVTIPAIVKTARPTTIKETQTKVRNRGRSTSTITTSHLGTRLEVEYNYNDTIYSTHIERKGYTHNTYKKGDTIHILINPLELDSIVSY